MPILKAAIKHARQSIERRTRRQPFNTKMKTAIRAVQDLVKANKASEAAPQLKRAYSAIDTAVKKGIIHWKNAAKKKSSLAHLVATKNA